MTRARLEPPLERVASVRDLPRPIRAPVSRELVARLPAVTPEEPTPLPLREVILLVPEFDPHRDAAGFTFDEDRARRAIAFFHECLSHVKGERARTPLLLELWQQAVIANAYGWVDADGRRRFREVFLYVPRKNGKTTLAGGVVLLSIAADGELGAEVYSAASEREQAALVFQQARGMVEHEPELAARCRVFRALKAIEVEATGSVYRAISSEDASAHGFNTSAYVMDELHAQRTRGLLDVLETSTGSRRQPLGWIITTADYDGPSICNEKLDYALRVRAGTVKDPRFLPVIYRAERDEDWGDERVWRMANPNLGISLDVDELRRQHLKAVSSPAFLNTFRRLRLNQTTATDVVWIDGPTVVACRAAYTPADLRGRRCYGGLDLAATQDLTAFALWFPDEKRVLAYFWVPADSARKRELVSKVVRYSEWTAAGWITATDGAVCDFDRVYADVLHLRSEFDLRAIAYDRWSAQQITNQLAGAGVEMVPFGQGFASMSAPMKELERLLVSGEARHNANPVLEWNITNVVAELDAAANIKPSKRKSREKIDGAVAWIMAIGASWLGKAKGPSVYGDRGPRSLGGRGGAPKE